MPEETRIVPVIMSGGAGTRLWPLSRSARPKQLLALTGDHTMLQMTAERLAGWDRAGPPIIVANVRHADDVQAQLGAISIQPRRLILEPAGRNTAPALALAALACGADEILFVMPSDHFIGAPEHLRHAIETGLELAQDDWLVTFGVEPQSPETGYGYIRRGDAMIEGGFAAAQFCEKPDFRTAEAFVASGEYYWNAGLFLFRAGAMLEALRQYAPDVLQAASEAYRAGSEAGDALAIEESAFSSSPAISIDYAVLEKAERVAVVPVSMAWSDIGSWDALFDLLPGEESGNRVSGRAVLSDVRNCLVQGEGVSIAALGIEDLIVVATPEAVLVLPRGRSQEIKSLVDALRADGDPSAR